MISLLEQSLNVLWRMITSGQIDMSYHENVRAARTIADLCDIQIKV
jgi:hypothetical protein